MYTETSRVLKPAYGEDCISRTQCHELFQRFKSGRKSAEDYPKTGRSSPSTADDHFEEDRAMIPEIRCLTVRQVSEEVGVGEISCHTTLNKKVEMCRSAAKLVPCLLQIRS